ncbi:hypothetical protein PQR05_18800 [Paraburkholderia sediminicola]|uniref:Uncharacterized protein n=1 Tax=Paraburkholderia metrosideri TaxID=580937 RepID=A0ABW9DJ81_9BURK
MQFRSVNRVKIEIRNIGSLKNSMRQESVNEGLHEILSGCYKKGLDECGDCDSRLTDEIGKFQLKERDARRPTDDTKSAET